MRWVNVNPDLSITRIASDGIKESIVVDVGKAKALESRLVGIDRVALPRSLGLRAENAREKQRANYLWE